MKTFLRHFLLLLLAAASVALAGTGCQTTKGFGQDVENLGEAIQNP